MDNSSNNPKMLIKRTNPKKTYLNFRNGLSLLYKNLSPVELIIKLPFRVLLDLIASLKFTLSGSFQDGRAVIKAHRHFLGGLNKERSKRREGAKFGYKKPTSQYAGSIVWDFFIAGKRKYSQLKH